MTIYSEPSLHQALGAVREAYRLNKFVRLRIKAGKARSLNQNDIQFVWYGQMALEDRQDDERGHRRYCKLHHGVPILRAEDGDWRDAYDAVIRPLPYEKKLIAMDHWPVTSQMTRVQMTKYLEEIQKDYAANRHVFLTFPEAA